MTTRTIEVTRKDFVTLDPPRHVWRVVAWQPPTPESRRLSADASRVDYDTEEDAVAAAKDLAARTGLPLAPEIRCREAVPNEYEERCFERPKAELGLGLTEQGMRDLRAKSLDASKQYIGWRWYLVERPRLEWGLFRKKGWRWYISDLPRCLYRWRRRVTSLRWWRATLAPEDIGIQVACRVVRACRMEDSMMTAKERDEKDRIVWIKCIRLSGPMWRTYYEDLPDGSIVDVSCMMSYDPAADEFLESEHRYGRIIGRPMHELAAEGVS